MQKDYNKHETNWSEKDWKNATVITWKTPIKDFASPDDLIRYLDYYLYRMREINGVKSIVADYRDVWQCNNEHYLVVGWNVGRTMAEVSSMAEYTFEQLEKENFFAEILTIRYGKNYREEKESFKNCVQVLETIDGNLVAVNEVRRALAVIQANNGYALKDDVDDDDSDDVLEAAE